MNQLADHVIHCVCKICLNIVAFMNIKLLHLNVPVHEHYWNCKKFFFVSIKQFLFTIENLLLNKSIVEKSFSDFRNKYRRVIQYDITRGCLSTIWENHKNKMSHLRLLYAVFKFMTWSLCLVLSGFPH